MASLARKVAVITGASRGLGRAIASLFAEGGATVIACARNEQALKTLAASQPINGRIVPYPCDITVAEQVKQLIDDTISQFHKLDILVNNAGVGKFGAVHELKEDDWDTMMAVNLKGPYLTCKYAIPHFIANQSGHIVNVSSVAGTVTFKGGGGYCASKFGLMALTDVLMQELKPHQVKVSVICPGSIQTEFGDSRPKSYALTPEQVAKVAYDIVTAPDGVIMNQVIMRPQVPPELQ